MLVQLLRETLAAFSEGRVNLAKLTNDVESLIDSLGAVADAEWVEELRSAWWQLEFVHATTLDKNRSVLWEEEERSVKGAVDQLCSMLVQY